MSVTMAKADGVTVFTLTSDPNNPWPPLCQIFKGLCYSPMCCTVSQQLKKVQRTSQSVLGTLHIMDGLLNIGLGALLICSGGGASWRMDSSLFPFWFGGLFIFFGAMCILSEKCPSLCLVILNVLLNVIGVAFAIAAIVLYSMNIADLWLGWMCNDYDYEYHSHHVTQSPSELNVLERCKDGAAFSLMILRGINGILIVLSVLELCVAMSSAIMGIKALCSRGNDEDESVGDPELFKPLLEEVTTGPKA